jgi:hypothetical protein
MEFIISKGRGLPKDKFGMESELWFSMWEKRNFPYKELLNGDILYWLDTKEKRLVWKTEVLNVIRYKYSDKNNIERKYKDSMSKRYFESRPDQGYFLQYEVKVVEKIDVPKPAYKFNQLAWERIDNENSKRWFDNLQVEDQTTIDDQVKTNGKSKKEILKELNQKMHDVSPERITKLISTTLRKDSNIINMLKEAAGFKCQFPNCGHQIKKENGGFYIEVAHIESVKNSGQSILSNLIVLCPNHHKEFDFGKKDNIIQTQNRLSGILNGKEFSINLDFTS